MQPVGRRSLIAMTLLLFVAPLRAVQAASVSREETAARIHRRRNYERRQQDLILREQGQIEGQRSRPIAPTGRGTQVVPNR